VKEVAKFTPGFTIRDAGNNPTAFSLAIRGQIQNDNLATLEPSVGVYLDDMYIARAYGMNTNLLDVKSAQVLKGPQGTLFGRNTSAGAVVFQTNDPKFNNISGSLAGTIGRFGQVGETTILNMGSETIAVRGALSYDRRGDYQTDVNTGKEYGSHRTLNGRVKVAVKASENLTLLASGEWFDGTMNGPARQNQYYNLGGAGYDPAAADRAKFAGNPDLVAVSSPSVSTGAPVQGIFNDMKTQTYMLKATLETGFGEVKLINGYRQIKGNNLVDLDGSSPGGANHFTQGKQDLKEYSSELQLTGKGMDGKLAYAFGATYMKEKGTDVSRSATTGGAAWSGFSGDINNESVGLYSQLNYSVTDKLAITGGLRWSHDKKGVTVQSAVFPANGTAVAACLPTSFQVSKLLAGTLVATDCNRSRSDTWNNVSYTIGADYKVSDDILLYVKQSRGYRAGAEQLRSLTLTDTDPVQPEIANEQEVGLKTEFLDKRVRFNVAGYHTTVKNAQRSSILSVGGTSRTVLENADTKNWGFEAELNVKVATGLNMFAGYSHTNPEYTKYNGFVVAGGVLTAFDKRAYKFGSIVKDQFTVGGTYNGDLGFARLNLNASYAWQGDMYQALEPISVLTTSAANGGSGISTVASAQALIDAGKTPAYGITNLRAGFSFGPDDNYEVAVWGRNVFDVRAKQYVLYLGGLNYVGASWNDPATYGVTVTAKF
jgi:iron complex outermembrane receptor protein